MCDSTEGIDRRTALIGAGCLALGALVPGAAAAQRARPRQSPIDLRRRSITFVDRLPKVSFRYPEAIAVTLVNTGSPGEEATVRADVPLGAARLFIKGTPLGPRAASSLEASRPQIGRFREAFPDGNAREVQRLNGRRVLSDAG